MIWCRRKGLEWQNELYSNLLTFLIEEIDINENIHLDISTEQLCRLSKKVFEMYGHRKEYQDKVAYFLKLYSTNIMQDLLYLKGNVTKTTINAPKLEEWLNYKQSLIKSMCLSSVLPDVKHFLNDNNHNLTLKTKLSILEDLYGTTQLEAWMKKKLNNSLWHNRSEICAAVKVAITHGSNAGSDSEADCLNGFTANEVNISSIGSKMFKDITSKLSIDLDNVKALQECDSPSMIGKSSRVEKSIEVNISQSKNQDSDKRAIPEFRSSNLIHNSVDDQSNKINNSHSKKSHKRTHGRTVTFNSIISKPVLEIFSQEDENDQILLFKKLVIFNIVYPKDDALLKYMNGVGRISRMTKENLLQKIYNGDWNETNASLLELLICKRYIIKQKVKDVHDHLSNNNINFKKEMEGMVDFNDIESRFLEVLESIKQADM